MTIQIKRAYLPAAHGDGYRVLVDRLWPRGVSREHAAIDLWLKDVAPTTALREWFNHQDDRFVEFSARYEAELHDNPSLEDLRRVVAEHAVVTLVYGAKNEEHNQAVVLLNYLG